MDIRETGLSPFGIKRNRIEGEVGILRYQDVLKRLDLARLDNKRLLPSAIQLLGNSQFA